MSPAAPSDAPGPAGPATVPVRLVLTGFCCLLVSMGLVRFAYVPLIPAVIQAGWFPSAAALSLWVVSTAGYLIGTFAAARAGTRLPAPSVLRAAMLVVAAAFFACSRQAPLPWFLLWFFISGFCAGLAIVLCPLMVYRGAPARRHGLVGGFITSGMGVAIILTGLCLPVLVARDLRFAWIGLGALSLALALVSWRGFPRRRKTPAPRRPDGREQAARPALSRDALLALRCGYLSYTLGSVGLAFPHLLLVDFLVRGLGRDLAEAGFYWLLVGVGAILGPLILGPLGDVFGKGRMYRVALLCLAFSILLPALATGAAALALAALGMGLFNFGQVPLLSARQRRLVAGDEALSRSFWGTASIGFSLGQIGGGALFAVLLERYGDYTLLIYISAALCLSAWAIEFALARRQRGRLPAFA